MFVAVEKAVRCILTLSLLCGMKWNELPGDAYNVGLIGEVLIEGRYTIHIDHLSLVDSSSCIGAVTSGYAMCRSRAVFYQSIKIILPRLLLSL